MSTEISIEVNKPRPNRLLRDYYQRISSIETPTTSNASTTTLNSSPVVKTPETDNIETEAFDLSQCLKTILTESTIVELLKKDNTLINEMKQIDSDRKTLFYENYSKLLNASDTIKNMRENVETMEKELIKLSQQVQDITSSASNLHGTFAHKKTQVYRLKNSASLLRRLQFLFTLPKRLSQSAKDGSYLRAVQFFATTKDTLERYRNVPVFAKVANEAKTAVNQIRASIFQKLKKEDLSYPQLIEAVQVLIAIAMDPPLKLVDLLLDNGLRIVNLTLKQDVPWLPLASAIYSDAISSFKPEPPEPVSTKKNPSVITLPVNEFNLFQSKLDQFLTKSFESWETQSKVSDSMANLDRHLKFREELQAFPEVMNPFMSISRKIMETVLTLEIQTLTLTYQGTFLSALYKSPEHVEEIFKEILTVFKSKLETLRTKLGQDSQTTLLNNAIYGFLESLFNKSGLEPAYKLPMIQLAQSIYLDLFETLFNESTLPYTEIKTMSKKAAEESLAQFVNTQAGSLQSAMQEWSAPNSHPKGISSCVHVVCKQLNQLHQIVNRVFQDGQDGLSMDSSLNRKKRNDPTTSFGHHATSHSVSSVRSTSPSHTLSTTFEKPPPLAMLKMDKFFTEKLTFYARPEINGVKYPIMPLLLRIFAKGWLEQVRLQTLTKFGFQQIIVDVEFCKLHFNEIVKDRHVLALLEEVVTSAYHRCVDPLFLSKESINAVLRAQDPIEDLDHSLA